MTRTRTLDASASGRRLLATVGALLIGSCTSVIRAADVPNQRPTRVTGSAPIALVPPLFEIPAGTLVGGHAINADRRYSLVHEWQSTFTIEPNEFNHALRDELRTLGYQVSAGTTAEFGLQPVITRLVFNLFGTDASVGWSEAEITVRWQVLGNSQFAIETRGSAMAQQHTLSSIFQAFRISLRNFLADPRFATLVSGQGIPPMRAVEAPPIPVAPPEPPPVRVSAPPGELPELPAAPPSATLQRIQRPADSPKVLDGVGAAQRARASVVTVLIGDAWGSGSVVSADGLIVTQASLVANGGSIAIVTPVGKQYPAKLVRTGGELDVALLQVSGVALDPIPFYLAPASPGEMVTGIGTPYHPALSFSVSQGRVTTAGPTTLGSDVPVSQGNAGGPLVDMKARAIGIVIWGAGAGGESAKAQAVPAGAVFRSLGLAYPDADKP